MNAEAIGLTPEQKDLRRSGTGGSEIGAVVGVNPWSSAFDVFLAKVDGFEQEQNEAMERGTFLEDGVARWYAHRTKARMGPVVGTVQHASNPHALCTPDRIVLAEDGLHRVVSIKVPGPTFGREEWGEDGSDDIPTHYLLQLQWEIGILGSLGAELCMEHHLAAPIDGSLRVYRINRDHELFADLLAINDAFWRNHVLPRVPPPVDGSEGATRWLARRFPRNNEPPRHATPQEAALAFALMEAESKAEAAKSEHEAAKNRIKECIGSASGIEGPFGSVTWKSDRNGKRSLRTNWRES